MIAAKKGDTATVRVLLDHSASALARDKNGDTALLLAARKGQVETVELLRKPAVSLHHLYSPPHFKAFLWMTGTETHLSDKASDQVMPGSQISIHEAGAATSIARPCILTQSEAHGRALAVAQNTRASLL